MTATFVLESLSIANALKRFDYLPTQQPNTYDIPVDLHSTEGNFLDNSQRHDIIDEQTPLVSIIFSYIDSISCHILVQ